MTFKQRLPYFLVGLFIGIMIVIFIFGKKNTTFDYGPNARVLKNIRTKTQVYSPKAQKMLNSEKIDTSAVTQILKTGDADLWNKVKTDSCIQYTIKGAKELKNISIVVKNCDSTAFIEKIIVE